MRVAHNRSTCARISSRGAVTKSPVTAPGIEEAVSDEVPDGKSREILARCIPAHDVFGRGLRDGIGERLAVGEKSFRLDALEQFTVELRWWPWRGLARIRDGTDACDLQRGDRDECRNAKSADE